MATIEEKQKELDALQTDFDEYIVSARELEEELDAELTKCREYYKFLYVNICRVSLCEKIYTHVISYYITVAHTNINHITIATLTIYLYKSTNI